MALTHIVGYLLSRDFGSGGLVSMSGTQMMVASFPPLAQVTITSGPFGSDYANIYYHMVSHPRMVPDAFSVTLQYSSLNVQTGIASGTPEEVDGILLVTRAKTASTTLRNRTNMNQFYGGIAQFLVIRTQSDFLKVVEELDRMSSSKMEGIAIEANQLLTAITQQAGIPRSSLRGGG